MEPTMIDAKARGIILWHKAALTVRVERSLLMLDAKSWASGSRVTSGKRRLGCLVEQWPRRVRPPLGHAGTSAALLVVGDDPKAASSAKPSEPTASTSLSPSVAPSYKGREPATASDACSHLRMLLWHSTKRHDGLALRVY